MANICVLTGRPTADLELKKSQSGISVCSFTLAVKRPRTKDVTDFINVTAFRQSAEYLSTYAKKGTLIEVSGALTSRKWTDKNDNKRTSYEVIVDTASIMESKKDKANVNVEREPDNDFEEVESDGDLPF